MDDRHAGEPLEVREVEAEDRVHMVNHVPEFDEILREGEELLTLPVKRFHGAARAGAHLRVKGLDGAYQDIGIYCDHQYQFSRRIAPSPTPGGTSTVSKSSSIARSGSPS